MPCNDPNCECHQSTRANKISTASGAASQVKPMTAIFTAHEALGDAAGLANRVCNLVDALLGPDGPDGALEKAPQPSVAVLPSLADHAIGTATRVAQAQRALDRLETHTLS